MQARDLIGRTGAAAAATGHFDGLFLAGSFGRGTADEWSDVDLVGLAPPERHEAIAGWWRGWLEAQEHLIYFKVLPRGGTLINAVLHSWLRVDLHLAPAAQFGRRAQDGVRALHDPGGIHATLPPSLPPHRPDPKRVEEMIWEFIRILGLTPVTLGRGEHVVMVTGTGLLRDLLSQLMQEELPFPDRGGMLHLGKLLPRDDMALLESLPYPGPEREALIEAQLALARVFFPRARQLAARLGVVWPEEFETVSRAHLARAIGREPEALWPDR